MHIWTELFSEEQKILSGGFSRIIEISFVTPLRKIKEDVLNFCYDFFFYSSLNRRLLLSRPSCTRPVCGSNRLWEAGELWDKPACGAGGGGHWEKWVWQVSYRIRTYILYISLMFSLWQIAAFTVQLTCYVKCWCGTMQSLETLWGFVGLLLLLDLVCCQLLRLS